MSSGVLTKCALAALPIYHTGLTFLNELTANILWTRETQRNSNDYSMAYVVH